MYIDFYNSYLFHVLDCINYFTLKCIEVIELMVNRNVSNKTLQVGLCRIKR